MASFDRRDVVEVLSTQVLSHDASEVLVEAGHSAPLRWFIKHGNLSDHAPEAIEDIEDIGPVRKRRKVSRDYTINNTSTSHAKEEITLSRTTLELALSEQHSSLEGSTTDLTTDTECRLPMYLQRVHQEGGCLNLRLAHASSEGAVLNIDISEVDDSLLSALKMSSRSGSARPAVRCRCFLVRSIDERKETITLELTIAWADGLSAFPAGAPVGGPRYYEDYALYSYFFPTTTQLSLAHSQPWTPGDFYESVHTPDKAKDTELRDVLETQLFPFQRRAVAWMMARENATADVFSLFESAKDADGHPIYHNSLQAIITRQPPLEGDIHGGILAEEMGLGKTVEVMALVVGQPCTAPLSDRVYHHESEASIRPSKATLIITPPTILHQWTTELSQHAPKLKVYVYTGITGPGDTKNINEKVLLDALAAEYDVVLTTYQTLSKELYFAVEPPKRDMRHARKYERRRSPLMQLLWWRICLDEAQMVESGVTAAARVACRLPRVNSWAVSGTPVKKNVEDLLGLLVFLRLQPFASNGKLWEHLIMNHRYLFRKMFGTIALRHTKAQIREDIQLPPQKRVVMTLPFTAVESQHYTTLFQEMCREIGVEQDGSPSSGTWDPENPRTIESMRTWLARLRQTCSHPQIGGRNRRRLGKNQGPLRTVAEVLDVMVSQNEVSSRAEERSSINALIERAHIIGNAREDQYRAQKACELYRSAQKKCELIVADARARLAAGISAGQTMDMLSDDEDSTESGSLLGHLRTSLRAALQLLHVCIYFAATATYQIKVNEEITKPESDEFKLLEQQETDLYEQAKVVRREILKDAADKSERIMSKIKALQSQGKLVDLPDLEDLAGLGGIESRRIISESYLLFDFIRAIKPYILEWRAKIVELLSKALVDEDDAGNEITGEEYEDSTKQQDALYVYLDASKAIQADLNRCITGEAAPLIDHEARTLVYTAKRWFDPEVPLEQKVQPHDPELLLNLFNIRQGFRSQLDQIGSIRGLIAEARQLEEPSTLGLRAAVESELAQKLLRTLQGILSTYTKALDGLSGELDLCVVVQNQRLDFYRQLQEVSDAVAPYKEELDEILDTEALQHALNAEEGHLSTLAQLKTKHRFLMHLKQESSQQDSARICVICQCPFEIGVLTVCGHQYCKECIQHWWTQHRSCPVCKRKLALVDFHNVTYKPKEVKIQEENQSAGSPEDSSADTTPSRPGSIYSEVDGKLRDQIKSYDLSSSYGTKIDTLSRHLLWIREHDPGAKSIVFSQYREFLDVLSAAFADFKIGHQRLGRKGAVENFRYDASIDCLLLDAKTDSSGLTLVNATHVFVCEPLVQTAVELQAIARVHRIGQVRRTTVWMYLVNDTVEESIYEISVARRMAHVQARQLSKAFQKSRSSTPGPVAEQAIDAANSEELQNAPLTRLLASDKGGGELVEKSDLWQCLFGKAQKIAPVVEMGFQAEIDRNIRAQAADNRTGKAS